jgi:hypothetical protein
MLFPARQVLVLGLLACVSASASTLYSIGPDTSDTPRSFTSIPSGGPGLTPLFNLGTGLLGYNGGLTYRPIDNRFYVIGNDNSGNSTLQSFTLAGPSTLVSLFGLGTGFLSGLTFDSGDGNLYAIADDLISGHSFLDRINLGSSTVSRVLDLGAGFEGGGLFTGGLTYDTNNGLLYALGADSGGVSRAFYEISLAASTTTFRFDLANGTLAFNGGLLFDSLSNQFFAISNDSNGNSALTHFALNGGGTLVPDFLLGLGFNNVALTEITPVPEPSWLFAAGLGGMILGRKLMNAVRRLRSCS